MATIGKGEEQKPSKREEIEFLSLFYASIFILVYLDGYSFF